MLPLENYAAPSSDSWPNLLSFTHIRTWGQQGNRKSPSGSFEKLWKWHCPWWRAPPPPAGATGQALTGGSVRGQVRLGRAQRVSRDVQVTQDKEGRSPVDDAGPVRLPAVLPGEPGGAGALVVALLEVHAGPAVSTGRRGASPDVWGEGREHQSLAPRPPGS